eukprot:TRINITY_DN58439_c0_g1_i1.p1 TRINITY_DN58439_c0_g1~~TRINITY_DN58439_c0_g1_i1.p1  ORF type:complete len:741 (+),score=91.79 TRINITY_DN58439_c0_g1_i1:52-2274(+)
MASRPRSPESKPLCSASPIPALGRLAFQRSCAKTTLAPVLTCPRLGCARAEWLQPPPTRRPEEVKTVLSSSAASYGRRAACAADEDLQTHWARSPHAGLSSTSGSPLPCLHEPRSGARDFQFSDARHEHLRAYNSPRMGSEQGREMFAADISTGEYSRQFTELLADRGRMLPGFPVEDGGVSDGGHSTLLGSPSPLRITQSSHGEPVRDRRAEISASGRATVQQIDPDDLAERSCSNENMLTNSEQRFCRSPCRSTSLSGHCREVCSPEFQKLHLLAQSPGRRAASLPAGKMSSSTSNANGLQRSFSSPAALAIPHEAAQGPPSQGGVADVVQPSSPSAFMPQRCEAGSPLLDDLQLRLRRRRAFLMGVDSPSSSSASSTFSSTLQTRLVCLSSPLAGSRLQRSQQDEEAGGGVNDDLVEGPPAAALGAGGGAPRPTPAGMGFRLGGGGTSADRVGSNVEVPRRASSPQLRRSLALRRSSSAPGLGLPNLRSPASARPHRSTAMAEWSRVEHHQTLSGSVPKGALGCVRNPGSRPHITHSASWSVLTPTEAAVCGDEPIGAQAVQHPTEAEAGASRKGVPQCPQRPPASDTQSVATLPRNQPGAEFRRSWIKPLPPEPWKKTAAAGGGRGARTESPSTVGTCTMETKTDGCSKTAQLLEEEQEPPPHDHGQSRPHRLGPGGLQASRKKASVTALSSVLQQIGELDSWVRKFSAAVPTGDERPRCLTSDGHRFAARRLPGF